MGGKIKKSFEKIKALLQNKINCTKFVLKCHIYIIKIVVVGIHMRGSLRGSKRIKKGKITMKSRE